MLLLVGVLPLVAQQPVPPNPDNLVTDYAGMLSPNEEQLLRGKLNDYARETSTQIAIVTEERLNGNTAFDRGMAIATGWGIGGSAETDNGILIYIARDDRRIQILTGYGTEGFLPDVYAKRIIDNVITPAFRQGNVYGGLDEATTIIMDLGQGEYTAEDLPTGGGGGIPPIVIMGLILVVFVVLSSYGRGHDDDDDDDGGYWRNGPYDMDDPHRKLRRRRRGGGGWIFLPGGGFGGGGGGFGGGGGGGFGGFGGGGFGGGGAGGGW